MFETMRQKLSDSLRKEIDEQKDSEDAKRVHRLRTEQGLSALKRWLRRRKGGFAPGSFCNACILLYPYPPPPLGFSHPFTFVQPASLSTFSLSFYCSVSSSPLRSKRLFLNIAWSRRLSCYREIPFAAQPLPSATTKRKSPDSPCARLTLGKP